MDYIRWYNDGKFSEPEKFEDNGQYDNIFKIGDKIKPIYDTAFFWDGMLRLGRWAKTYLNEKFYTIRDIEIADKDIYNYNGQLIKIEGHWPWFQSDCFEKVN